MDAEVDVVRAQGPVPFRDLVEDRDELLTYQHMYRDGAPHQGRARAAP